MEKLYPSVCSVVPAVCKPKAVGRGIAIWAKVEQKGRVIFPLMATVKDTTCSGGEMERIWP